MVCQRGDASGSSFAYYLIARSASVYPVELKEIN